MYEDILADNVNLCQIRASIFDAPYFWYNDDTKNCKLISSSERQCDQIIGTPTPEYEPVYCGDEIPKRYLLVMSPSRPEGFSSVSKQPTQLFVKLNSSLRQIIDSL